MSATRKLIFCGCPVQGDEMMFTCHPVTQKYLSVLTRLLSNIQLPRFPDRTSYTSSMQNIVVEHAEKQAARELEDLYEEERLHELRCCIRECETEIRQGEEMEKLVTRRSSPRNEDLEMENRKLAEDFKNGVQCLQTELMDASKKEVEAAKQRHKMFDESLGKYKYCIVKFVISVSVLYYIAVLMINQKSDKQVSWMIIFDYLLCITHIFILASIRFEMEMIQHFQQDWYIFIACAVGHLTHNFMLIGLFLVKNKCQEDTKPFEVLQQADSDDTNKEKSKVKIAPIEHV
ncbi:hypothetical protein CRE_17624 [Caenorhabditis remanei]|uniref:Uncharacterized protein n=1 Tax=Caenorhabditis remanei TaxID=31234 RepID=E3NIR8_CAERE|nr:hypothetical protein CRE_17624 [Caenorhabditis remanei]